MPLRQRRMTENEFLLIERGIVAKGVEIENMAEFQSIEVMAKRVAEEAKKNLEVNDMPLDEFIVKVDGVAEFLKSEIRICDKRLEEEPSPYYDGVNVGFTNAQELNINHIRFCKKLLEMMNFEQ